MSLPAELVSINLALMAPTTDNHWSFTNSLWQPDEHIRSTETAIVTEFITHDQIFRHVGISLLIVGLQSPEAGTNPE